MTHNFPIGNTPLLQLAKFCPQGALLGKAECFNPTGSIKDRTALAILQEASLPAGSTVIEATSGNMGISLAALCARMGYACTIVMPENMSIERQQSIRCFGAQVVLTPERAGMQGAVETAALLAANTPNSFLPCQFDNPANVRAHYTGIGPEIWAQCHKQIDVLVAGVGTGGTITGTGRYLKEQYPPIKIVAVEPAESPLLSAGRAGPHGLAGIGANFVPKVLDRGLLDQVMTVSLQEALDAVRRLAKSEGLLCGISSGAALHAGKFFAQQGLRVVAILPDTGLRYLSKNIF